ncbi:hypothetical protein Psyc_0477 [Psychrobacter arcticus 273-4]|uniref:Uncharacterized protein n=1 Tax=Psychrobacter arcticus (strain DSM 17307 / VKM B-2377 / 273-4) TaxID=259536 RepID=Q4FUG8_PSYA2|nr:hypothetical protein [Psychrobacter arcticus]AAZ18340.1 hypothetical protein Psyc_0477 [Psychrobacter arcticus 273-4]
MSIKNIEKQPVILNAQEVRAILHGGKTQHRSVIIPKVEGVGLRFIDYGKGWKAYETDDSDTTLPSDDLLVKCPYGAVGDILNLQGASSGRMIRLGLKITAIRIEQLQDISHKDAVAEGVNHFDIEAPLRDQPLSVAQIVFSSHWDAKQLDDDTGWDSNPWVWVIEFEEVAD